MRKKLGAMRGWMLLILGGVLLVNIKRVFVDFDVDCEYAIALSYRMARGDHMISQMWEPHQTSAFLNAAFIWLYMLVTGTTTGLALYLNGIGLLAKLGVAAVFFRTLRKDCDRQILLLMCAFFLAVNAKNTIILDFSNLMVYFSILSFCALYAHLRRQEAGRPWFLILAAACFCLEVLAYPSALILFPLMLAILYRYSAAKGRDMAVYAGTCFALGAAFAAFVILQTGWERFLVCVRHIVTGDSTHQVGGLAGQLMVYAGDLGNMAVLFAACGILAFLAVRVLGRRGGAIGKGRYVRAFFALLMLHNFCQTLFDVSDNTLPTDIRLLYTAIYVPVLVLAFALQKHCAEGERMAFRTGAAISIGGSVAVLLLTNLTFLTTAAYLILGIMVSMLPIGAYLRQAAPQIRGVRAYRLILAFLAVVLFRNVYVMRPLNRMHATVFSAGNVVLAGPMMGICTDYMGAYIRNSNLYDWTRFVREGDRILIVGLPASTIGYLYEDTEICVDSTISTPTYSEKLLDYWELNPWKEPNVVILDCWFGEPRVPADAWIMGWLEENFDSYEDGTYVRVYRRE